MKSPRPTPKKKKQPIALYVGMGILTISLLLLYMKDIFSPNKKVEDIQTLESVETRFRDEGSLTFSDASGKAITTIAIEIADTEERRTQGLMGRKVMRKDHGMLFVFPEEELRSFWMANTPLSLDIIYLDAQKRIINIHSNTTPYSEDSLPSERPAQYTVEVIAGFCVEHGINEGDIVNWSRK